MTKRITALLFGLTILCTAINAQSILEQQMTFILVKAVPPSWSAKELPQTDQ